MLKYLPLLLIVLTIDLLVWNILGYWIGDLSSFWQMIINCVHFLIPIGLMSLLYGDEAFRLRKRNRKGFVNVYSFFQLVYICKVVGLVVFAVFVVIGWSASLFHYIGMDLSFIESVPYYTSIIAAAIPLILLPYGMIFNRHRYQIRNAHVVIKHLPVALRGLKIVQISDVHAGSFFEKEGFEKGVAMINGLEPDLIFFTGDLVNNRAIEIQPFVDTFSQLKARYGVYSILGNHDYGDYVQWRSQTDKVNNLRELVRLQRSMGWHILLNEHDVINIDQAKVAVIGVENYSAKLRFPKYGDVSKATAGMEAVDLQLLLSHDPSHWRNQIVSDHRSIDVTFSGHTHGMQFGIEIGKWQWSPIKYVYAEWAGLYQDDQQYLYVNRGFGVLGYPGRVGILPEITLMTISDET